MNNKMKSAIYTFMILLIAASASAALVALTPQVAVYAPVNNTTATVMTQDFLFQLLGPEPASACSLVIDGDVIKTYVGIPKLANRQFKTDVSNGQHTWQVNCEVGGSMIKSQEMLLFVNASNISNCVQKVYKGSGTYRYTLDMDCSPATAQGLRTGDWIELRINEVSRLQGGRFENKLNFFIIYVLQTSSANGQDFVRLNTNRDGTKRELFLGSTLALDSNQDGIDDINLSYDRVSGNKATVTVTMQTPVTSTPTENTEETVEEEVVPVIIEDDAPIMQEEEQIEEVEQVQKKDNTKLYVTIILIAALIVILIYISKGSKKQKIPARVHKKQGDFMLDTPVKKKPRKKS